MINIIFQYEILINFYFLEIRSCKKLDKQYKMFQDATSRFARTVENYVKYRPGYPKALFDFLQAQLHLTSQAVIADIGSGTGKSTEPFLMLGNAVFAVEPNPEMRQAAEQLLKHFPGFTSVNGIAEATTLPDQCADFVIAGTAFHWFEPVATHREFQRILKPDGYTLLTWNVRNNERSDFMLAYEAFLLNYSSDYERVRFLVIPIGTRLFLKIAKPLVLKDFWGVIYLLLTLFLKLILALPLRKLLCVLFLIHINRRKK